jgi:hypothetical protein
MTNTAIETVMIQHAGGEWKVFVHAHESTVHPDAREWFSYRAKNNWKTSGQLLGYLRRYGKTNGGKGNWHIFPQETVNGTTAWSLYVASDDENQARLDAHRAAKALAMKE